MGKEEKKQGENKGKRKETGEERKGIRGGVIHKLKYF